MKTNKVGTIHPHVEPVAPSAGENSCSVVQSRQIWRRVLVSEGNGFVSREKNWAMAGGITDEDAVEEGSIVLWSTAKKVVIYGSERGWTRNEKKKKNEMYN